MDRRPGPHDGRWAYLSTARSMGWMLIPSRQVPGTASTMAGCSATSAPGGCQRRAAGERDFLAGPLAHKAQTPLTVGKEAAQSLSPGIVGVLVRVRLAIGRRSHPPGSPSMSPICTHFAPAGSCGAKCERFGASRERKSKSGMYTLRGDQVLRRQVWTTPGRRRQPAAIRRRIDRCMRGGRLAGLAQRGPRPPPERRTTRPAELGRHRWRTRPDGRLPRFIR
jgi:hypothetical protein